jgi:hypothetical protein
VDLAVAFFVVFFSEALVLDFFGEDFFSSNSSFSFVFLQAYYLQFVFWFKL